MAEIDITGLVLDKRAPNKPGTHALIVGIDDYPNASDGGGPLAGMALPSLSTAVRSALAFHHWLAETARLPVPLATCRLLLSPLPRTQFKLPLPEGTASGTTNDFLNAAWAWRQDARASRDDRTIFFFCGHKLQISYEEDILLFQNFGEALGPSFRGAVSFVNVFNGMAAYDTPIAQNQLYFLDGSRHRFSRPSLGERLYGATDVFDTLPSGPDQRAAGVFHAAAPGNQAYSRVGQVSLFTQSVIKGLEGAAAVPQALSVASVGNVWGVTLSSLSAWMTAEATRVATEQNVPVTFSTSVRGDGVIAVIAAAPTVRVDVKIEPAAAADGAELIVEGPRGEVITRIAADSPRLQLDLQVGLYALSVVPKRDAPGSTSRQLIQVLPGDGDMPIVLNVPS